MFNNSFSKFVQRIKSCGKIL